MKPVLRQPGCIGGFMARNRNYPPTTIYQIHDYETDKRDLEKAKAEEQSDKMHSKEHAPKDTGQLTPNEEEMLKYLRGKKSR